MADIYLKKIHGVLAPADDEAEEVISKLKRGECIRVKYTKPRNYEFHKKYFAMIQAMFDCQDFYTNQNIFRKVLEMAAGHFDQILTTKGTTIFLPKSISFADLDQEEFEKIYQSVITAFVERFGGSITKDELMRVVDFS